MISVPAAKPSPAHRQQTRRIAWGGLLTALAVIFVSLTAVAPTADLALFALSSLCVAIAVIQTGYRGALTVYLATGLLTLIWPGLALNFLFIFCFGLFPLLKGLAESHWPKVLSVIVKQLAASIMLTATVALFLQATLAERIAGYGPWIWPVLILLMEIVIFLYDYALTLLIQLYTDRISRHSPQ